ncbi:MAG: hybrid sensor histidine kinase/response regulator, partial [Anaerolineae bacterium]|nr:hybrid sensor histidine kinase/response regulator [Anaerolineae bacterium]
LTYAGYNVLVAERALEGIDMARQHRPDLILTDINLPDLSGREITVRLRADPNLTTIPIVALTAQSHAFEREKTIVAGVTGYITKPVDVDELTRVVGEYLKGRTDPGIDTTARQEAQRAYNQELVERLEASVRDLETNNRDLRHLDQLKDDFIQLTAHELRTPLTTVYGYSRLVQTSAAIRQIMALDPEVNACMTGLIESIERLQTVVDEIIVISRIASGRLDLKLSLTHLDELITCVIESYALIIAQRKLKVKIAPEEWAITFIADRELLELALGNLLGNAIKYTPDEGVITLSVTKVNERTICISTQDSGIGIDPKDQQYVFDRFYTAGDTQLHSTSKTAFRGGGLGLGLAICKGIVEAHQGRIWVESECCDPDKNPGSTFFIELPLRTIMPDTAPPVSS